MWSNVEVGTWPKWIWTVAFPKSKSLSLFAELLGLKNFQPVAEITTCSKPEFVEGYFHYFYDFPLDRPLYLGIM